VCDSADVTRGDGSVLAAEAPVPVVETLATAAEFGPGVSVTFPFWLFRIT